MDRGARQLDNGTRRQVREEIGRRRGERSGKARSRQVMRNRSTCSCEKLIASPPSVRASVAGESTGTLSPLTRAIIRFPLLNRQPARRVADASHSIIRSVCMHAPCLLVSRLGLQLSLSRLPPPSHSCILRLVFLRPSTSSLSSHRHHLCHCTARYTVVAEIALKIVLHRMSSLFPGFRLITGSRSGGVK